MCRRAWGIFGDTGCIWLRRFGDALGGGKLGMIFGDTGCIWLGGFGDALGGG